MNRISLNAAVARCRELPSQTVLKDTYIVTPQNTTLHRINDVGTFIWNSIASPKTVEEIILLVCDEFDVEKDEAERDIVDFIQTLHKKELVKIE